MGWFGGKEPESEEEKPKALVSYCPKKTKDLPDSVVLRDAYYTGFFAPDPVLYVNFKDEDSLVRELEKFDIAGIILEPAYELGDLRSAYLLIVEARVEMKTSILKNGARKCCAVYDNRYKGKAKHALRDDFVFTPFSFPGSEAPTETQPSPRTVETPRRQTRAQTRAQKRKAAKSGKVD
ncbi:hypothetical protein Dda_8714 [Drechslerella dactyloides]|uniref:Uncharacterized protein n=1 Tax=Drechslerella dactyloides TaxID=74499 RepID=A0AAD6ISK6_DREDA|nr:hypothetical protein Dda_8714 [Drechslerella dactyloides]